MTNEVDIREEIATPFLATLGYVRGTRNEILREYTLKYDCAFLGRKKDNDPPLVGRADYILGVCGAARWTLEIKAPSAPIDREAIEQAMSYARHPQVAGTYAAVLNGNRFVVYHFSQSSDGPPIVDIPVTTGIELAKSVESLLSPSAIRRDCSPPIVDLNAPIALGFRSSTLVLRGHIEHEDFRWKSNFPLSAQHHQSLDAMTSRFIGLRSPIAGGKIWRDSTSRIVAKLQSLTLHPDMAKFANEKGLMDIEYVCLDEKISSDPMSPSIFDVVGSIEVQKGERLFDMIRWQKTESGIDVRMSFRGQAAGYLSGNVFAGRFQSEYELMYPGRPLELTMFGTGVFEVVVDPR
jgi:hypothetical protein